MTTLNPATESEAATGTGNPAGASEFDGGESHAPPRTPVRARGAKPNPAGSINASAGYRAWWASLVEPPEVWAEQRPSVEQLWWYAWRGKQAPESGLARMILMGWGLVGCVANLALYLAVSLVTLPCYVGQKVPHPDVLTVQRPSGRDIWRTGWAMHASPVIRWFTVGVMPVVFGAYLLGWVFARFSRSLAAGLLYIVAAHVIGLPWPSWLP